MNPRIGVRAGGLCDFPAANSFAPGSLRSTSTGPTTLGTLPHPLSAATCSAGMPLAPPLRPGRARRWETRMEMRMKRMTSTQDVDDALKAETAILFKHSTRCAISTAARGEMERFLELHPGGARLHGGRERQHRGLALPGGKDGDRAPVAAGDRHARRAAGMARQPLRHPRERGGAAVRDVGGVRDCEGAKGKRSLSWIGAASGMEAAPIAAAGHAAGCRGGRVIGPGGGARQNFAFFDGKTRVLLCCYTLAPQSSAHGRAGQLHRSPQ